MDKSESISNLCKALAAVQSALEPAKFDAQNPFLKNRYASLNSVFDACRHLLADNGLSVVQVPGTPPIEYGPSIALTTVLMHTSGEWLSDTMIMPLAKPEPQAAGSALTYARRYALSAIIGIVADDDDDGNAQARKPPKQKAQQVATESNGSGFVAGADVLVKGKHDEKPGTVMGMVGDLVDVKVDGKLLSVKPDRLTLVQPQAEQDPLFDDEPQPDTTYSE